MGLQDILFGTPGKLEPIPTMTSEQQQLLAQLLSGLGGPLSGGLQNLQQMLTGGADVYETPALRQFQEQIIPGIAERFSRLGAGAQRSSAFGQQLGAAGAGLSEKLAMQRAGLQSQALSQLQSLLGVGIGARPFEMAQIPGTSGGLTGLLGGIGTGLGAGIGTLGGSSLFRYLGL